MQQTTEKIRTYHIFYEEEDAMPVIEIESDPEPEPITPTSYSTALGVCCSILLVLLCLGTPLFALELAQAYPNTYDTTLSRTVVLTLGSQVPLVSLPEIRRTAQLRVVATGIIQQDARAALGLITFYNVLFREQVVSAGTILTSSSGVAVVTLQEAIIPAAIPSPPPTPGTVSVEARALHPGSASNIAATDINQVCCGGSILAENQDAFSGGQDAHVVPVLTTADMSAGKQKLSDQVGNAVSSQASAEEKPGDILLPLSCNNVLTSTHHAGDLASVATLTLVEVCSPLAYFAPDIASVAQRAIAIPRGYHLVSFSAFVYASHLTSTGGTLTVDAIAYLKHNAIVGSQSHYGGK